MNNATILVIDDEGEIRKLLEITLESNGYKTVFAATGKEGLRVAANRPPDLILLDLGLPDDDGQNILVHLREWYQNPIIILTVKSYEGEIVKALDNGANDYLTKPFRTQELLARIRTALRNVVGQSTDTMISFDNVTVDLNSRIVKADDQIVKLTVTEYTLLALLLKNQDRVLTHQYILNAVWGPSYVEQTQYLRVFIAQLRKKLEIDPNHPTRIMTESGIGYRFNGS